MPTIIELRHAFPENAGMVIDRPHGRDDITFLHFFNSVYLLSDGVIRKTEPHTCIFYMPNVPQYFRSEVPLLHDWMHFSGMSNDDFLPYGIPLNRPFELSRSDFITKILAETEQEFYAGYSLSRELMDVKLSELWIKLSRAIMGEAPAAVERATKERFRILRGEVFADLAHHWTVGEMAARVMLCESHFYRIYKTLYGISPTDDLIRARVNAAKNALLRGNESVSAIAESLGYANTTHFQRQFKALAGMPPATYRRMANIGKICKSDLSMEE